MNAIMIQNLKKNYGSFEVSLPRLDLRQGYVTGLVGKNGSGKTTLIRSVLGVIPRTAGTVQVLGGDITADPAIREQVGFVSETPYYIPTLTTEMVHEMVRPFYPRWDEELYQKMRAEFELPDRKIKELSKGQQKILSFLMALLPSPAADPGRTHCQPGSVGASPAAGLSAPVHGGRGKHHSLLHPYHR